MHEFKCPPRIFGARVALAALIAGGLFAAPPAAAQDYRLVTAKAISSAVSGISEANPGSDQAGGTNPASSEQAGRQEETPAQTSAGQKGPPATPTQP